MALYRCDSTTNGLTQTAELKTPKTDSSVLNSLRILLLQNSTTGIVTAYKLSTEKSKVTLLLVSVTDSAVTGLEQPCSFMLRRYFGAVVELAKHFLKTIKPTISKCCQPLFSGFTLALEWTADDREIEVRFQLGALRRCTHLKNLVRRPSRPFALLQSAWGNTTRETNHCSTRLKQNLAPTSSLLSIDQASVGTRTKRHACVVWFSSDRKGDTYWMSVMKSLVHADERIGEPYAEPREVLQHSIKTSRIPPIHPMSVFRRTSKRVWTKLTEKQRTEPSHHLSVLNAQFGVRFSVRSAVQFAKVLCSGCSQLFVALGFTNNKKPQHNVFVSRWVSTPTPSPLPRHLPTPTPIANCKYAAGYNQTSTVSQVP
uniref:Uncharacterized protein n=1 Tax=Timema shepardi TaxID=629360 RepID=A0A7R9B298_TIMSH|nr:unnamed protein product [Timema shepardi]